ncbi:hypothetical protein FGG08_001384 [Glutinoglossum americanum]|uniref:Dolichyl-diphosphooligosaccharide--protein glycosyltransferase subunit OST2 n=1 Tax=Glutinoglossum americanum TaxID=1670608 RepID=A0A9P8I259_9PEZI|nr:hypothetical protein FGG08_001384 [Glutinoglossum americanum]
MAPKRPTTPAARSGGAPQTPSKQPATPLQQQQQPPPPPPPPSSATKPTAAAQSPQQILQSIWSAYVRRTPQRVKLIDAFLAFLVVVGGLQFAYCVVGGNYPFNAFLSGFSATVGQFVLTASLRIQTNPENKAEFSSVSNERAFADYVFGSMLLHFICVNFIN